MIKSKNIKKIAITICIVMVMQIVLPTIYEVKGAITDNLTLIRSDIVTITKNTTISQINNVYGKEANIITPSAHGGYAYTWYKDNYTDLIFVETNSQGKVVSAGIVAQNFDSTLYSYGEKTNGRVSYMQGSIIEDWDNGVEGCFVYNKDTLNVNNYINEYMKDSANYDKYLCKHTIAILNQYLLKEGYIEAMFDEELYDKVQRIEDSGIDIQDYAEKNSKKNYYKYAGMDMNYLSLYEALPNPIRLAKSSVNYSTSDTCKYAYLRYHIKVSNDNNSVADISVCYLSKDIVENSSSEIKLTDEEKQKYNRSKEIYDASVSIFNENGSALMKTNYNYKTLPLVAGEIFENKLIGSTMFLNAIRVGGGLPELKHSSELSNYAQHKAVLTMYMSYNKIQSDNAHMPIKPDGVDDEFYNKAMSGMSAENLYNGDIISSITHAINDAYGDPITCGHRYNLLNPSTANFGMGYSEGQSCHKFSGVQSHNVTAVAWPSIGITPIEAYSGGYWSINLYNYTTTPETTVDVVRLNDNQKWSFTERTTNSSSRLYVSNRYVSFYNASLTGNEGNVYQITLNNLKSGQTDVPEYTYRTVFKSIYGQQLIEAVYPENVNLNKSIVSLDTGNKEQLTPTFSEGATEIATNWTSSNENIATVSQYGTITAKSKGETIITVSTLNGKTAICKVIVDGEIELNENVKALNINETAKINLTENFSDITYTSSNNKIASVDSNGNVTGISGGMSVINVSKEGYKNAIYVVYVKEAIKFPDNTLGYVGDTNLDGAIDSTDYSNILNSMGTNDAKQKLICDLNKDGVVNASDVNFIYEFVRRNIPIELNYTHIESVVLDEESVTILIGGTKKINAKITPEDVIDSKELFWKSSNTNVVQVDENGNITAKGIGDAIVTVITSNSKQTTIKVSVIDYKKGDYDESGEVDITDAYLLLRAIVNETNLSDRKIQIVDMDNSLDVDITDAYLLLRTVMKYM